MYFRAVSRLETSPDTDTAGCTYVKRSGSGDGVLDGIQPDITEESRKNYSRQYDYRDRFRDHVV